MMSGNEILHLDIPMRDAICFLVGFLIGAIFVFLLNGVEK